MSKPIRLAVVGVGKIARDQHLPSIARSDTFELAATVNRSGSVGDVKNYTDLDQLLASDVAVDAVALCMPPQPRFDIAARAIQAGLHVLLEKPPGSTTAEVRILDDMARARDVTLFATWHSRMAAGVEPARRWLQDRTVVGGRVAWREDVRRWHPGQGWIWEPGGLGVFDPGVNALSILTHILPSSIFLSRSVLTMPANKAAPIAAALVLRNVGGARLDVELDWREAGQQSWTIEVQTKDGLLRLTEGGSRLALDGALQATDAEDEYPALYRRFADLIATGRRDVDLKPLELVADAFLLGRLEVSAPFVDCRQPK